MTGGNSAEGSQLLRDLTSSDVHVRKEAFGTLRLYLQRSTPFDTLELLKLWKGLFYCMWMTANPKPQHRLAQDLASLVTDTLQKQNVVAFLDAFWQTMARQWGGIDSQRMDKYLRLMRLMLRAAFQCLGKYQFEQSMLDEQNAVMERTPLNINEDRIPNGMRYHVLDVFVDELEVVKDALSDAMSAEIIQKILQPVVLIRRASDEKPVRNRATHTLSDERLAGFGVHMLEDKANTEGSESDGGDFEGFGD